MNNMWAELWIYNETRFLTLSSQSSPSILRERGKVAPVMQTHANTLIRALQHLFCECLLNRSKASQGFFSVIYWIVLKHFNKILSTRWWWFHNSGIWPLGGGWRTSRRSDVNIGVLQPRIALELLAGLVRASDCCVLDWEYVKDCKGKNKK